MAKLALLRDCHALDASARSAQGADDVNWKLVPEEPTGEMIEAGGASIVWDEYMTGEAIDELLGIVYHAMLSAAPSAPTEEPIRVTKLEREITTALNCHSAENGSNTPDFILAQYLIASLGAFNEAMRQREQWYGREDKPASTASAPAERRKGERPQTAAECLASALAESTDRRKPNAAPQKREPEVQTRPTPAVAAPGAGETPLTNKEAHPWLDTVHADFARSLERALNKAREALRTAREVAHGEGWDEHMALVADRICVDIGIDACRKMDSALAAIDKLKGGDKT
jgi:hypothetical protein